MTEDKVTKAFPDLDNLYEEWQADPLAEIAYDDALQASVVDPKNDELARLADEAFIAVKKSRRTFGTVLTLAVTAAEMRQTVSLAQLLGLHAGITHDPTYPIFLDDGGKRVIVTAAIDSCAYVFGRKSACAPVLNQYDLLNERHLIR